MTLREKQSVFLLNVAKLIIWAYDQGYELTGGELQRTEEQQILYYKGYQVFVDSAGSVLLKKTPKKSKTMNSQHIKKLAVDLNLFKDGKYTSDGEAYKPLAEYWMSLHPDNVAGYTWGWDQNHFEMR